MGQPLVAALVAEGVQESNLGFRQHSEKKTVFERKFTYQLPIVNQPVFRKDTVNILDFGAKAGGIALNTTAINAAIDACNRKGGGVVLIPPGLWLSGPIVLRSYVNLHLSKGALLQFSDNPDQYPLLRTNWEGVEAIRNQSPISGTDLEDVAITGAGYFRRCRDGLASDQKHQSHCGCLEKNRGRRWCAQRNKRYLVPHGTSVARMLKPPDQV